MSVVVEQPPIIGNAKCSQKRVRNCSATLQTVVYGTELIASLIVGSNTVLGQEDRPLSLETKHVQVFGNLQLRTLENGAAIIA